MKNKNKKPTRNNFLGAITLIFLHQSSIVHIPPPGAAKLTFPHITEKQDCNEPLPVSRERKEVASRSRGLPHDMGDRQPSKTGGHNNKAQKQIQPSSSESLQSA